MIDVNKYYNEFDLARLARAKELSEIKRLFSDKISYDPMGVGSKAAVVLTYAVWEGFYNECVKIYIEFLQESDLKISEVSWMLMIGALSSEFDSLRQKNHTPEAKNAFVAGLKSRLQCKFDEFDKSIVQSRSNLSFKKFSANCILLGFDIQEFIPHRLRVEKELVGWRHAVAHGSSPDLSSFDIENHVNFAGDLILAVSGLFQNSILKISGG